MNEKNDDFNPEALGIASSRRFDETAALLAYAADQRRPPARLKRRLLADIQPAPSPSRTARWAAATALTALLLFPILIRPAPPLSLVSHKGAVSLSGRRISVSENGEAVVKLRDQAVLRLSRGARAEISRAGNNTIEVRLNQGWVLSAVRSGAAYRVTTAFGAAEALGTDFIVKAETERAYVCICRGKLLLTGDFPPREIAAPHHYDVFLTSSAPPSPAGAAGSMEGHSDPEIAALRRMLP